MLLLRSNTIHFGAEAKPRLNFVATDFNPLKCKFNIGTTDFNPLFIEQDFWI